MNICNSKFIRKNGIKVYSSSDNAIKKKSKTIKKTTTIK